MVQLRSQREATLKFCLNSFFFLLMMWQVGGEKQVLKWRRHQKSVFSKTATDQGANAGLWLKEGISRTWAFKAAIQTGGAAQRGLNAGLSHSAAVPGAAAADTILWLHINSLWGLYHRRQITGGFTSRKHNLLHRGTQAGYAVLYQRHRRELLMQQSVFSRIICRKSQWLVWGNGGHLSGNFPSSVSEMSQR